MVNLKEKPYFLNDDQITWVNETIASMTDEEKAGQFFICLNLFQDEAHVRTMCEKYHVGGVRWQMGTVESVYEQNRMFQEFSKIPVLIAANCEAGGNGAVGEGTLVAPEAACGAASDASVAYNMGRVSAEEAVAIGCNWTFAPIADVYLNPMNTIVNTRSFGNDPDKVIDCCKAYMKAMREKNILCAAKHFPGDGSEARDQHLVMGCNDLSVEEWDRTYGKVYRALIEDGIESIMVGHICQPAYQKLLNPALKDEDILPATLSSELLNGLLRDKLGFNGLVVTDASHMAGLNCAADRFTQVTGAIQAGCDMFLFFNDPDEDLAYMLRGIREGVISEQRLNDALQRILGLKAKLQLYRREFPPKAGLVKVGCEEHRKVSAQAADESITLVKDVRHLLPLDTSVRHRARLYYLESQPLSASDPEDPARQIVIEELERAGFEVSVNTSYYDLEREKSHPFNRIRMMDCGKVEDFKERYDVVFMVINMKGYAKENNVRAAYSCSHSNEIPWFMQEVPTVGISLNYTNHLYDLPMLKTYINAYAPTREYIRAAIEKITGKSAFKGQYNETVWCGRWDTRV